METSVTQIVGISCAYPGRADPAAATPSAELSSSAVAPLNGGASAFLAAALAGDDIPSLVPAERQVAPGMLCAVLWYSQPD